MEAFSRKFEEITTSILKLVILTFIFIQTSEICAKSSNYLRVNLPSNPSGMFSVFSYVAGVLFFYDQGKYAGIEVDFENSGLYYDPLHGSNWWEYYCEPIRIGNKRNAKRLQTGFTATARMAGRRQRDGGFHRPSTTARMAAPIAG